MKIIENYIIRNNISGMIDPCLGKTLIRILLAYDEENHDDYIETGEGIDCLFTGFKFKSF